LLPPAAALLVMLVPAAALLVLLTLLGALLEASDASCGSLAKLPGPPRRSFAMPSSLCWLASHQQVLRGGFKVSRARR
jgi:hypothetical protein